MSQDASERLSPSAATNAAFRSLANHYVRVTSALADSFEGLSESAKNLDAVERIPMLSPQVRAMMGDDGRKRVADVFARIKEGDSLTLSSLVRLLWEEVGEEPWGPSLVVAIHDRALRPRREPMFNSSMLMTAVASFESHLTRLASEYYRQAPDSLHALPREEQKEFSLRDLQGMKSVADAVNVAIERRVGRLSYGGLADWNKFFKDRMSIDFWALDGAGKMREIFERRNCIVHHDGRASRRYVDAIRSSGVRVGDSLAVDSEYVADAIDLLDIVGLKLAVAVWQKFSSADVDAFHWLFAQAYEGLKESRWRYSTELYSVLVEWEVPAIDRLRSQVNLWLARKGLRGVNEIRDEVEKWDVSAVADVFHLAKACLIDDLDTAFRLLPTLIEKGDVTDEFLATWPLLSSMRADVRIEPYSERLVSYIRNDPGPTSDAGVVSSPAPEDDGDAASELAHDPSDTGGL